MKFLKDRVRARRLARAESETEQIARINARLAHIDGQSDVAERLRERRAAAWGRRNNLYLKLTKE